MVISEFIYTVVFKPRVIKTIVNNIILTFLPKTARIGPAVVCLNPRDPVVSGALTLGVFEKRELRFFLSVLREGMTVVDVGANVGLYTAVAMQRIKGSGRIVAFEPHAESRGFLFETVNANAAQLPPNERPEVIMLEYAASSSDGEANLYTNSQNKGDNRLYPFGSMLASNKVSVPTRTIDLALCELGITTVDFMKVDVQGYEFEVIRGAASVLQRSPNAIILSEFWPDGIKFASKRDSTEYLLFLSQLNFRIFLLGRRNLKPLHGIADFRRLASQLKGRQYANIVCTKSEASCAS